MIGEIESLFGNDIEDDDKDKFKRSVQSYGEEGRSTETFSSQHTPSRKIRNLSEKKRRDQFNMLINELCSMVSTNNRKMDKSTVLKSTIAFLKNYQELAMQSQAHEIKEDWKPSFLSNDEFTQLMLEALDSFLLVFTQQGKILYASESITSLLGHLSSDLINRSLYDLIHESEQLSLHNLLHSYQVVPGNEIPDFEKEENQISFMCHLKRGAMKPVETDVYEYVKVTGSFRKCTENILQLEENSGKFTKDFKESSNESTCFCCTIQLQPCQLIREMSSVDETKPEFSSRHSFEWKFLFLDYRAPPIIGYLPFEVLGTSGYDYYHPDDLDSLAKCHEQLMQAGEGTSCFYRFLTKGQQWIWLKTRYYITYHQWNSKPEFIVCTHTVVSYANVQSHGQKNHRYTDEEVEAGTLDSAQSEKSCHSSVCCHQSSPTYASWSSQLQTTQVALTLGKTSRQLRASEDQADTTEKPHSTLDEVSATVKTVLKNSQLQTKQQASASPQFSQHQCVQQEIPQQKQILAFPSSMMMMMAASPCNIPTSNQESVQISTIGQQSVAVPSLTLPQTIYQPPSTIFPRFYMTPAQQQLHEQLKHKSQQLQQTILRQQEELQKITEELSLAQQGFLPGAQMLMINPSSFQTNNEVHSSSPTSQFNVLQQQFLPLHLLAASNGQVLQQSPSSSSSATHP